MVTPVNGDLLIFPVLARVSAFFWG